jgi:hypothetical protein
MKNTSLTKSLRTLFLVLTVGIIATSCWESDAENAVEDMGEHAERTLNDVKDNVENVGDNVEDSLD